MRAYEGDAVTVLRVRPGAGLHVPARAEDLAAHYDLTISHPSPRLDTFAAFDDWLAEAAAEFDLSCGILHDGVVAEAVRRLGAGQLSIGFHLDYFSLWHIGDNPYARLAIAIQDAGGRPVNLPGRARAFTDKASAHGELVRQGLGVPHTLILRPWTTSRPLTDPERAALRLDKPGARLYIKPANGYGGRGVVRIESTDPDGIEAAIAAARQYDRQDSYLLQREIRPPNLACEDGVARPAHWRVLYCLGEWTFFWWQPQDRCPGRPSYRLVTPAELRRHRLQPVLDYAHDLAEVSGLEWFSTELCLGSGPETSRHMVPGADGRPRPVLAIDYFNDQCDVDVQSRWLGAPPDHVVRRIAQQFAETAWRFRQDAMRSPTLMPWREAA
jgi:hypothetical protein